MLPTSKAIDAIWENVVQKKLYITGGIGASGRGEAFGDDYELPNMTAYNETCAAIGNDYWNHRLFLLHADAKYIDVMERTLYNGLISGVSLDGKSFFYPNPLESNGQHERSPWFGVACCPGNMTRFLASVPGYVYAQPRRHPLREPLRRRHAPTSSCDGGRSLEITQETRYPWDGAVTITRRADGAGPRSTISLRIPGWARNEPVPCDLYRFQDAIDEPVDAHGQRQAGADHPRQGLRRRVARTGSPATSIELALPMPVRRVIAHDRVEANRDRVALQRGPIVYCAEGPDNAERARAQPRAARCLPALDRVPADPAQRRAGDHGQGRRALLRRQRDRQ